MVAASSRDPDLAPFVGDAHLGHSLVIARPGGAPHLGYLTAMEREEARSTGLELLSPELLAVERLQRETESEAELWSALLATALAHAGVEPARVGLAGRFPAGTVHAACSALSGSGWRFEAGHRLLLALGKQKTDSELAEIRRVAAAAIEAIAEVARTLAAATPAADGLQFDGAPLTAGRLRARISAVFAGHQLEQPHGNIVAAGTDAGVPHSQGGSDVVLRAGQALVVDLFPKGRLYADCTRTFCVGEPPPELARAHATVVEILAGAHRLAEPGRTGTELHTATCERFEEAGYPTPRSAPASTRGYVHGLGHGVGFDLHEYPTFRPDQGAAGELTTGDVFTLEPGLYDPEAGWGVRVEDLCHLGLDGLENLTPLPYELDPQAWD